ncbi:MAG: efflux RND transporter periplasmic adaptor subunit [Muribaculaceae bacterium]|nr:efflux RND transporter periplasmic adaptor subunit [Muribaculaceae bacterium]
MKSLLQKGIILPVVGFMMIGAGGCKKKEHATVSPPVKVTVMEMTPGAGASSKVFSGTVSSSETTTVSFAVGGTISSLPAKEGQKVVKGSLLGKVRSGDYENAYNIALAELAEARDGYERLKKLHDANALPDVKWVEIQQKLKQAENAAEMAKRTLDDATLHSPVAGTITRKFADEGQTVLPAQPVFEIVSTGDLTIDISLSEKEIGGISIGDKAQIRLDALSGELFEGKVTQKSVVADPLSRTYTVKVSLPKGEGKILPGMLGSLSFIDDKEGRLKGENEVSGDYLLPSGAVLLDNDNRWFVWVVEDSVAARKFVTIDNLAAEGIIVKSGLERGDKVIVAGMQKVGTGTKVCY